MTKKDYSPNNRHQGKQYPDRPKVKKLRLHSSQDHYKMGPDATLEARELAETIIRIVEEQLKVDKTPSTFAAKCKYDAEVILEAIKANGYATKGQCRDIRNMYEPLAIG